MAKRRRKRSVRRPRASKAIVRYKTKAVTRYRTRAPARRHRRRGGGGGGGSIRSIVPNRSELYDMGAAAVIGFIETKAKDDSFILNKIPKPIAQIGWMGNMALALRLANVFLIKKPIIGRLAHTAGMITAYQIGRQGKLFTQSTKPESISGDDDWSTGALDVDDGGQMGYDGIEGDDLGDLDDGVDGIDIDPADEPGGEGF